MLKIDRMGIQITRGDTVRFVIALEGREVADGTKAIFTVKSTPWEPCQPEIEKTISVEDGKVYVMLDRAETDFAPGHYVWDVRVLEPENGKKNMITPMEYAAFRVVEAIGDE